MRKKFRPNRRRVLITGASGLVGYEAVRYFCELGHDVVGVDNDMRSQFFGMQASTRRNRIMLEITYKNYLHVDADIRDAPTLQTLFQSYAFSLIIHAAAQPSHDWAADHVLTDFHINALATVQLLELVRRYAPEAVFIFTSSNKLYGDRVNTLPFRQYATRFDLGKRSPYYQGIPESFPVDTTMHTLYGASKAAADLYVQEYGRYFGLPTAVFRASCITGSAQRGAVLHGFLAYLATCVTGEIPYTIYGYDGKQVRDNIHAYDLVRAFHAFANSPKSGAVYNIGGSRETSLSVREAIDHFEKYIGKKAKTVYDDVPRRGDFKWYITDTSKFRSDFPGWRPTYTIDAIIAELSRRTRKSRP